MEVCCRSDVNGINGCRDVTFPYLKKGSREHILSCLIAYRIPYDKQMREVVGRKGRGRGWEHIPLLYHQLQMLLQITSLSTSERF